MLKIHQTKRALLFIWLSLFSFSCGNNNDISFGIEYYPASLDPVKDNSFYATQIVSQIYEPLLTLDQDYNTIKPNLVRSWEISSDNCMYSFTLQDDIYFHNGRNLNAWDVKNTFDSYLNNSTNWLLAKFISEIIVTDTLNFNIILVRPYAPFLYLLCSPYIFLILQYDSENSSPVGTGPFYIYDESADEEIILKRFDNHRNRSNSIRSLSFIVCESDEKRRAALINHDIDIQYLVSGHEIDRLRWKGQIGYHESRSNSTIFLGFNLNDSLFKDIRVRQAVLYSLNLPKIVYNLNRGNAMIAHGPLPPVFDTEGFMTQATYDPDKARSLLKAAGCANGIRIRCNFPRPTMSRLSLVETIKSELAKTGIIIEPMILNSWQEHTDSLFSKHAQMFYDGAGSILLGDPGFSLQNQYHSQARFNFFRYENNYIDSLLARAEREADKLVRKELYREIVNQIINDTPAVFFSHVIPHFAFNTQKIKKMYVDPYRIVQFNQMELH
jgi:peptide/nickel transport system substrate-binding protein